MGKRPASDDRRRSSKADVCANTSFEDFEWTSEPTISGTSWEQGAQEQGAQPVRHDPPRDAQRTRPAKRAPEGAPAKAAKKDAASAGKHAQPGKHVGQQTAAGKPKNAGSSRNGGNRNGIDHSGSERSNGRNSNSRDDEAKQAKQKSGKKPERPKKAKSKKTETVIGNDAVVPIELEALPHIEDLSPLRRMAKQRAQAAASAQVASAQTTNTQAANARIANAQTANAPQLQRQQIQRARQAQAARMGVVAPQAGAKGQNIKPGSADPRLAKGRTGGWGAVPPSATGGWQASAVRAALQQNTKPGQTGRAGAANATTAGAGVTASGMPVSKTMPSGMPYPSTTGSGMPASATTPSEMPLTRTMPSGMPYPGSVTTASAVSMASTTPETPSSKLKSLFSSDVDEEDKTNRKFDRKTLIAMIILAVAVVLLIVALVLRGCVFAPEPESSHGGEAGGIESSSSQMATSSSKASSSSNSSSTASSSASASASGEGEAPSAPQATTPIPEFAESTHDLAIGSTAIYAPNLAVRVDNVEGGLTNYDGATVTCVTVTYMNMSETVENFYEHEWKAKGPDGADVSPCYYSSAENELGSGKFEPGTAVTGNIYFEGDVAKIEFQSALVSDSEVISWLVV